MLNDNLLSLSYGRIINKNIDTTGGLLPESFETYQIVSPGDIIMRLTDLQNDKRSIRQGLVKEKGIITSAYDAVYPKKDHDSRYWAYALLAMDLAKYYYSLGGGVRQSIKFKDFPNDWLHTPPYETQKEIADFLDRETARIDQLIEKKNHFLSILQEKLQSKANDVDEYSAGIPRRLRHLIRLNPGKSEVSHLPDDHEVTFLPMEAIDDGFGGINDLAQIRQLKEVNGSYTYFSEGDMLLAKVTPCFENGKKAHAINLKNGVGFGTSELHVLRISHGIIPEYLNLMLSTSRFRAEGCISMTGAGGLKRVSERAILDFKIQLPSEQEQKTIAARIVSEIAPIQEVSQKTNLSIEKLKDLKNSLITEAVTGQLDIQKWQQRGMTDSRLDKIEEDMQQSKRASA
jgi:type I restriction enzyme S subunit